MDLLTLDLAGLLMEYARVTDALGVHLDELAQARAAENEVRLATWFTAPAETQKHRDLMADQAAQSYKRDIYVMGAHVDKDRARLALIDVLMAHK